MIYVLSARSSRSRLTLALLVARVVADDHDATVPADDAALAADLLDARLDLHWVSSMQGHPRAAKHGEGNPSGVDYGLLVAVDDPAAGEIVGTQFNDNTVIGQDPDVVHPHLPADVSENLVPVVELDPEHGVRERLDDGAFDLDGPFFFGHVLRASLIGSSGERSAWRTRHAWCMRA
jgi:hypothetical protein